MVCREKTRMAVYWEPMEKYHFRCQTVGSTKLLSCDFTNVGLPTRKRTPPLRPLSSSVSKHLDFYAVTCYYFGYQDGPYSALTTHHTRSDCPRYFNCPGLCRSSQISGYSFHRMLHSQIPWLLQLSFQMLHPLLNCSSSLLPLPSFWYHNMLTLRLSALLTTLTKSTITRLIHNISAILSPLEILAKAVGHYHRLLFEEPEILKPESAS